MSKKSSKGAGSGIKDPRFANFETDPRFRLPSKKNVKTQVDERFAGMFKDKEFTMTSKVDRWGRKNVAEEKKKKKALGRLYQLEDKEEEKEDKEEAKEGSDAESVDDDEKVQRDLEATARYDPARDGGFLSSDDDSSDDELDERSEMVLKGSMQRLADEQAEVEGGEITRRIAIVNLDWDYIRAADLMVLFTSFLPAKSNGKVLRVSVYPSEFGKERMVREEAEGPPKEIFKGAPKVDDIDDPAGFEEEEEDSEVENEKIKKELLKEGNDQDFDCDALRGYQLDRLRYFYAVMECSDAATAKALYEQIDGTEYLSSSNFLDLRFIPDDTTFDSEPRDSVSEVPKGYKPVEFVTNALQSSKVKLTWDMHPDEGKRKESMRKAFSGSRGAIEENDLRAYLASDDSEDEEDDIEVVDATEDVSVCVEAVKDKAKLSKKELAKRKMRESLGLSAEPSSSKKQDAGPVGDMQITFTPALTEKEVKKDPEEETTLEKYMRKEKERKEKKRAKAKAKRGEPTDGAPDDASDSGAEMVFTGSDDYDAGFDDPFFTTEDPEMPKMSKTALRKEERLRKRAAREQEEKQRAAEKQKLAAVMVANEEEKAIQAEHLDHFDMADIRKAERAAAKGKRGRKGKRGITNGEKEELALQEDYKVPVDDERFQAVFMKHEFAIDPSNPKFSGTRAMKEILEVGRKKRKGAVDGDENGEKQKTKKKKRKMVEEKVGDYRNLVESLKKKAAKI